MQPGTWNPCALRQRRGRQYSAGHLWASGACHCEGGGDAITWLHHVAIMLHHVFTMCGPYDDPIGAVIARLQDPTELKCLLEKAAAWRAPWSMNIMHREQCSVARPWDAIWGKWPRRWKQWTPGLNANIWFLISAYGRSGQRGLPKSSNLSSMI